MAVRGADMTRTSLRVELAFQNVDDSGAGRITAAARLVNTLGSPPRVLDCYAVVLLIRGGGFFRDGLGHHVTLQEGSAFVLFPGILHEYGPGRNATWDELYVLFEGPAWDLWRERGLLDANRPVYPLFPLTVWESRLRRVWESGLSPLEQLCRLQLFLAEARSFRDGSDTRADMQAWLAKAQALLSERALAADGVQQAAREMGVSYQTFRKRFRRLDGRPPGQYQTERVLEEAARRLLTNAEPIKRIAEAMHFCDEFHFARRFKKYTGVSPGAYRQRMR